MEYYDVTWLKNAKAKGIILSDQAQWILDNYGDCEGPLPPVRHLKQAYHYWLQRIDFDGHRAGYPIVCAWLAQAKHWCLPNLQATGRHFDAKNYIVLGLAELPDPENYYRCILP